MSGKWEVEPGSRVSFLLQDSTLKGRGDEVVSGRG